MTPTKILQKLMIVAMVAPLMAFAQDDSVASVDNSNTKAGGMFVEPGITYSRYESSIDYPAPFDDSSGKVQGLGVMARLGFHINEAFFVAADARYSMPKFEDSTNELSAKAKQHDIGPVVGFQMPDLGLRIWGEYVLTSELDPESSNGFDYKFTGGKGYRVGAGFRVAMVSLNLEYQDIKYGRTDVQEIGPLTLGSTDMINFDGKGFVASVTFPLEL